MNKCLKELSERAIEAETTASAKALRCKHARDVKEAARRPIGLELNEQGDESQRGSDFISNQIAQLRLYRFYSGGKLLDPVDQRNAMF